VHSDGTPMFELDFSTALKDQTGKMIGSVFFDGRSVCVRGIDCPQQ
jgi:hypothetical protein